MKHILTVLVASALALATPKLRAQDFYSGYPGPRTTQLDLYVMRAADVMNGTIIPKAFLGGLLLAAPIAVTANGFTNQGINVGYIAKPRNGFGTIVAAGLFRDAEGNYRTVMPQFYVTKEYGGWLFDAEAALPVHLQQGAGQLRAAITIGALVSSRLRAGVSVGVADERVTWQVLARYELARDHSYWMQLYMGQNSRQEWTASARLAVNIGR